MRLRRRRVVHWEQDVQLRGRWLCTLSCGHHVTPTAQGRKTGDRPVTAICRKCSQAAEAV